MNGMKPAHITKKARATAGTFAGKYLRCTAKPAPQPPTPAAAPASELYRSKSPRCEACARALYGADAGDARARACVTWAVYVRVPIVQLLSSFEPALSSLERQVGMWRDLSLAARGGGSGHRLFVRREENPEHD